jgi:hypothetical protein
LEVVLDPRRGKHYHVLDDKKICLTGAFVTVRSLDVIEAGQEIFNDYGKSYWVEPEPTQDTTADAVIAVRQVELATTGAPIAARPTVLVCGVGYLSAANVERYRASAAADTSNAYVRDRARCNALESLGFRVVSLSESLTEAEAEKGTCLLRVVFCMPLVLLHDRWFANTQTSITRCASAHAAHGSCQSEVCRLFNASFSTTSGFQVNCSHTRCPLESIRHAFHVTPLYIGVYMKEAYTSLLREFLPELRTLGIIDQRTRIVIPNLAGLITDATLPPSGLASYKEIGRSDYELFAATDSVPQYELGDFVNATEVKQLHADRPFVEVYFRPVDTSVTSRMLLVPMSLEWNGVIRCCRVVVGADLRAGQKHIRRKRHRVAEGGVILGHGR